MRRLLVPLLLAAASPVLFGCATNAAEPGKDPGPRVTAADDGERLEAGTPVPYTALTTGMCSSYRGDPRLGDTVGVVDCAVPHRFEIVAPVTFPEPPGAAFPGMNALRPRLREACEPHLRPFVGDRPGAQVTVILGPLGEEAWNSGNRLYYCAVGQVSPSTGRATTAAQGGA